MEGFVHKFQDLKIDIEEIKKATNQNKYIGGGGFGKVYEGEVSHSKGRSMAAVKCLDRSDGQGEAEFMKEINTLSNYKHENLISLLGFCYQGEEAFIVYELASHGSLDDHLSSPDLTWSKRIKICLGAAKGLRHLHDPKGTHQRVIHCDVKSANILLDDQWDAKVADFGFSIMGPANELRSAVINLAAGTVGYCDPQYVMTNTLTKESDVYSFGVVLVEVLCGALCYTCTNDSVQYNLVPTWIKSYEEKKLNDTIFKDSTIQPMHEIVLQIFSDIAYQCLKNCREDRPTMVDVVTELETSLDIQELLQNQELLEIPKWSAQSFYYKTITKSAVRPMNYRSEDELMAILFEGVHLNGGKTLFSLNTKGEHCEKIYFAACLDEFSRQSSKSYFPKFNSRSATGTYFPCDGKFNTSVKAQFLSPGITYTVNLLFTFRHWTKIGKCEAISLRYKLQGEREFSVSHMAYEIEDEWWIVELYQFTSDHKIINLNILFDGFSDCFSSILATCITFQPLEKVDENQSISDSDSDANWEEKLPTDFEDIMKLSKNSLQWTTKEEAYSIMRNGFLINDSNKEKSIWFSLDKNGKKCHMLSASEALDEVYRYMLALPESRFGEASQNDHSMLKIVTSIQSQLVSTETTYAIYLVYKISKDQYGFEAPMEVEDELKSRSRYNISYIYLVSPQTPVIKPKSDQNIHNPPTKLAKKSIPQQRNDGWMEVQLLEFQSATTTEMIPIRLELQSSGDRRKKFKGLIIEGIEIRPI